MSDDTKHTNVLRIIASRLMGALCSMKLAILALLLIGIISLAGAIIPQNASNDDYIQHYGKFIAMVLTKTGITNIFATWYFIGMIVYLVTSMTFCSIRHLPQILKVAKQKSILTNLSEYELAKYYKHFTFSIKDGLTGKGVRDKFSESLKKSHYNMTDSLDDGEISYFAVSKGRSGLFGPFLVHLSIIVIAIGAALTAAYSYSYFLNIPVDETMPLPNTLYSVKLHDFEVNYYENTDLPSEYKSVLSMNKGDIELGNGDLTVNSPINIDGMNFYQMEYNPNVTDVTIEIRHRKDSKVAGVYKLPIKEDIRIDELGLSIVAFDLLPDFALVDGGIAVSRTPIFKNPAVMLDVTFPDKKLVSKWVFEEESKSGSHLVIIGDYVFELKDYTNKPISGILIIRDKAIPIVYAGFALLTVGSLLSCYVFHRRVWIMVTSSEDQIQVSMAGKCNRNILDFRRELSKCIENICLFDKEAS